MSVKIICKLLLFIMYVDETNYIIYYVEKSLSEEKFLKIIQSVN